ncbi:YncE family protein, partial [Streptomyces sp. NPDC058272]
MPSTRTRHLTSLAAALALTVALGATATAATARVSAADLREVMFVGNNWDGTADV